MSEIKRALISVSDKNHLVEFAKQLHELNIEIISTGGTSELLKKEGIPHVEINTFTGMAEMLEGRVKTLHPKVHGGILGKRDKHAGEAKQHDIEWIDLVVVNFYPFEKMSHDANPDWEEVVEYIDIGGPTMVRAAAKNFKWVGVITDPADYDDVIRSLREEKELSLDFKMKLAQKAFGLTAHYEAMIHTFFQKKTQMNDVLHLQLKKHSELRYGENPHQKAVAYSLKTENSLLNAVQHQGKELSYNNLLDSEAALACVKEFHEPACVIVKHANPCGVAVAATIEEAYQKAYLSDAQSAFGGIVAINRECTKEVAEAITGIFIEVMIAPSFAQEALAVFSKKPNLRVLQLPMMAHDDWEMRFIQGGVLMQERDTQQLTKNNLHVVTTIQPTDADLENMLFAWHVLKHVKSNGILLANDNATVGVGAGQVSRIDAVTLAIKKAKGAQKDCVLASDAFFPFRDSIDEIAKSGIKAIIQPGGSLRDEEVIAACHEHGIAMVFTGKRCFKH